MVLNGVTKLVIYNSGEFAVPSSLRVCWWFANRDFVRYRCWSCVLNGGASNKLVIYKLLFGFVASSLRVCYWWFANRDVAVGRALSLLDLSWFMYKVSGFAVVQSLPPCERVVRHLPKWRCCCGWW